MPSAVSAELMFLNTRARVFEGNDGVGVVDMIEVPAGEMSPLHVHHTHDEGFYLMAGELTLFLPGREVVLRPGDFLLAPRGVPHTYRVGDQPARWLVISSPAGFERFVVDVARAGGSDPAVLAETAARHGIEILGPPGAMP